MDADCENCEEFSDEQCQQFVEQFVQLTNTDEALAQFFLQDRNWNVSTAVNDYFNSLEQVKTARGIDSSKSGIAQIILSDDSSEDDLKTVSVPTKKLKKSDDKIDASYFSAETNNECIRFITWNIDGLSEKNIIIRTEAVCSTISGIDADIIHLQEVVPQSENIIRNKLQNYSIATGKVSDDSLSYYTLTLLNKNTVQMQSSEVIDFKSTEMARNVLKTEITIYGINMTLFNSHLESTNNARKTRISQLSQVFSLINAVKEEKVVVFAGDMNLRDSELTSLGGLPSGVVDVWEATGRRQECQYTWDMTRNDNLECRSFGKGMPPRCRFDRVFFRDSLPSAAVPLYFGLIGIKRLNPFVCFPSDHWGILSQFEIKTSLKRCT